MSAFFMGILVIKRNLQKDAEFYFQDDQWPGKEWSNVVSVHANTFQDNNLIKIDMRKWIERNTPSTVILDIKDLSYRRRISRDLLYEVSNTWYNFHFDVDSKDSALAFSLTFLSYVEPMTLHHPDYPEDSEWISLSPAERVDYFKDRF